MSDSGGKNPQSNFAARGSCMGRCPSRYRQASVCPDWLKEMPSKAFRALNQQIEPTVKRCPPFVDAMTNGFLIPTDL